MNMIYLYIQARYDSEASDNEHDDVSGFSDLTTKVVTNFSYVCSWSAIII